MSNAGLAQKQNKVVRFGVESENFAISIFELDEIVPMMKLKSVPLSPEFLEGVINLRGTLIPTVDLKKILGKEREGYPLSTKILIMEILDFKVACIVDDVYSIEDALLQEKNNSNETAHEMVQTSSGELVACLQVLNLFRDEQWKQIQKVYLKDNDISRA